MQQPRAPGLNIFSIICSSTFFFLPLNYHSTSSLISQAAELDELLKEMGSQMQAETSSQKRHLYLRRSDVLAATSSSKVSPTETPPAPVAPASSLPPSLDESAQPKNLILGSDRTVLAVRGLKGTTLQVADPDHHKLVPATGTSSRR